MTPRAVIDHVVASIGPLSEAQAEGARQRLGVSGDAATLGHLAVRLAAARHAPRPRVDRKTLVICAGDHGVADPGVALGAGHPTAAAVAEIARGTAAVCAVARSSGVRVLPVDCGVLGPLGDLPGLLVLRPGRPAGTADIATGPAMTVVDAVLAIQTGIATLMSLADDGLDVLALGHVAWGAEPSSTALIAALTGTEAVVIAAAGDLEVVTAALAAAPPGADPIELLAALGGTELAVMVGLILGAASLDIPVVLDDHGTSAAALVATRIAPRVAGYLVASQVGTIPAHRRALTAMGLAPLIDLGVSRGEGTGAALALAMVDGAARLLA